jgi:hypothetical protein
VVGYSPKALLLTLTSFAVFPPETSTRDTGTQVHAIHHISIERHLNIMHIKIKPHILRKVLMTEASYVII